MATCEVYGNFIPFQNSNHNRRITTFDYILYHIFKEPIRYIKLTKFAYNEVMKFFTLNSLITQLALSMNASSLTVKTT